MSNFIVHSSDFIWFAMLFFFKQKTAYEMRISDWSSDVCSSDLRVQRQKDRPKPLAGQIERQCRHRLLDLHGHPIADCNPECSQGIRITAGFCEIGRESCRERVCQYV